MSNGMVKTFGDAVREWRVTEGLSLHDLADLLRLDVVQMASIERGCESDIVTRGIMADLCSLGFRRTS